MFNTVGDWIFYHSVTKRQNLNIFKNKRKKKLRKLLYRAPVPFCFCVWSDKQKRTAEHTEVTAIIRNSNVDIMMTLHLPGGVRHLRQTTHTLKNVIICKNNYVTAFVNQQGANYIYILHFLSYIWYKIEILNMEIIRFGKSNYVYKNKNCLCVSCFLRRP